MMCVIDGYVLCVGVEEVICMLKNEVYKISSWSTKGHTLHNQRPVTIALQGLILVEKVETVQIHFTLEGEGLSPQRNYRWWIVYIDSYIIDYRKWFSCKSLTSTGYISNTTSKLRSTPSSTPIWTISLSLIVICNCEPCRATNAQIHQLDDSTKLEVSN